MEVEFMTDNIKQSPPAPLPKRDTADQDLVAAWDERQRQSARIRLKATEDGPMVLQPDINDETLWQARLSKALGVTDPQVIGNVLSQLGSCSPDGNVEQMLNLALELLDEVKPRSPVETLLLVQMTSLHTVGLDLLRRANTPTMTPQESSLLLHRANQLCRTYMAGMETLQRCRKGGQQKMTVEHVHVNAGGQAVVGSVGFKSQRQDDAAK